MCPVRVSYDFWIWLPCRIHDEPTYHVNNSFDGFCSAQRPFVNRTHAVTCSLRICHTHRLKIPARVGKSSPGRGRDYQPLAQEILSRMVWPRSTPHQGFLPSIMRMLLVYTANEREKCDIFLVTRLTGHSFALSYLSPTAQRKYDAV